MFITLEGIEGSGKSTLAALLTKTLQSGGRQVVFVREPGGTALGNAVRAIFLDKDLQIDSIAELMLINASRRALVNEVIRPALGSGAVVVCDRYVDSTRAYQGFGRGLDLTEIDRVCGLATGELEPDVTLLLDLDIVTSQQRLMQRGGARDRMEKEANDFHTRVREGFLALAQRYPRIHRCDATQPVEQLLERALSCIASLH